MPVFFCLPQGLKFSLTQLVVYILLLRNLTVAHFTFINTLTMLDTCPLVSDWYILVVKHFTKLTVDVNGRFSSL